MDFARDLPVLSPHRMDPGDRGADPAAGPRRSAPGHPLDRAAGRAGHHRLQLLLLGYQAGGAEFQFREEVEWIPAFGMGYRLGVDGLSVALVILTTVLSVVAILYSWAPIQTRVKEYYADHAAADGGHAGRVRQP